MLEGFAAVPTVEGLYRLRFDLVLRRIEQWYYYPLHVAGIELLKGGQCGGNDIGVLVASEVLQCL